MKPTIWEGCYESSWKGMITDKSFSHPAKYSRDLIERIFRHCLEQGYVRKGDLVGDCFGGIATGGIAATYADLRWIGVELEPRFVTLGQANLELHAHRWRYLERIQPALVQGDSRKFDEIVREAALVACSPPYSDIAAGAGGLNTKPATKPGQQSGRSASSASQTADQRYGASDGQISKLKEGSLNSIVTSPPFTQTPGGAQGINTDGYNGVKGKDDKVGARTYQGRGGDRSSNNIETLPAGTLDLAVTSPPYADSINSDQHGIDFTKAKKDYPGRVMHEQRVAHADKRHKEQSYGKTEGQIGALHASDINAVVTSPPWEKNNEGSRKGSRFKNKDAVLKCNRGHGASDAAVLAQAARDEKKIYGDSEGQIGKERAETYWQAMKLVYEACFRAIKPDGVICVVVKDYVKNKKRVPLCDDTARLLEHLGFVVIERVHAMLVKETEHGDLFGGSSKTKTERKSFFRRLAEKKGSPKIDYEEVVIARRPA